MIAIRKGAAPLSLLSAGEDHARELCAAYEANPEAYQSGETKMSIRESIYKLPEVKDALEACHHGKCCYCENVIAKPRAHSHIEHWRPKSCSRQGHREKAIRPGYYWLAYSWENLLLSCCVCNRYKCDFFPLDDPATRARHHGMRLEDESPAILKPDGDVDPSDHIRFEEDVPVGRTALGRRTIEVLGLDSTQHGDRRKFLADIRKDRQDYMKFMNSPDPSAREFAQTKRRSLEEAILPDKPYSAMVAIFLAANPLPDPAEQITMGAGGG